MDLNEGFGGGNFGRYRKGFRCAACCGSFLPIFPKRASLFLHCRVELPPARVARHNFALYELFDHLHRSRWRVSQSCTGDLTCDSIRSVVVSKINSGKEILWDF